MIDILEEITLTLWIWSWKCMSEILYFTFFDFLKHVNNYKICNKAMMVDWKCRLKWTVITICSQKLEMLGLLQGTQKTWVGEYVKSSVDEGWHPVWGQITYPFPNFDICKEFDNEWLNSYHTSPATWLLIHAEIKVNPCYLNGSQDHTLKNVIQCITCHCVDTSLHKSI